MSEQRVKKLFLELLDMTPARRPDFLERACDGDRAMRAQLEALLRDNEAAGTFFADPTRDGGKPQTAAAPEGPGSRIGKYHLLQVIGEGGFGVVYMAQQTEPIKRKVALKVIKLGMDTRQVIARFEAERQALAMMEHENIAKVLDAGATGSGRPYFVMELVKGVPITEYCDRVGLSTEDRLGLFTSVCHAIQHAHQKGIIHRDIKPSNVMVTLHDGVPVPKVIDFGIAKATDHTLTERTLFTEYQQMIGTPEYMSPEQAEISGLDIDTRADIYSLGVLLYELLTGTKPLDIKQALKSGYEELMRQIREIDPDRPSERVSSMRGKLGLVAKNRRIAPSLLPKLLTGDLDWIVMKAIEKDRSRRYDTATAFADDVNNYLKHMPVDAGPPRALYRARKFVRRNRLAVAAGTVVAVALLVGFAGALWGFIEARTQRTDAIRERDAADLLRVAESAAREKADRAVGRLRTERDAKEKARAELDEALTRSEGTRLVAQSRDVLESNPSLAVLLAIEGAKRLPGFFANQAMLAALREAPRRELVLPSGERTNAVVWAPNGSRVAIGGRSGAIRIHDARTGRIVRTLRGHTAGVHALRWESGILVSASMDESVRTWDPATGKQRHLFKVAGLVPYHTRLSPGGRLCAVVTEKGFMHVLDVERGRALSATEISKGVPMPNPVPGTFSRDGRTMTLCRRGRVMLWDVVNARELRGWPGPINPVAVLSADGRFVLTTGAKGQGILYDAATGEEVRTFEGHKYGVRDLRFLARGRRVMTVGDAEVRVWATMNGTCMATFPAAQHGGVAATADGERVAIGMRSDRSIHVYEVGNAEPLYVLRGHDEWANIVAFEPSGSRVLSASPSEGARIWEPQPRNARFAIEGKTSGAILAFSHDGRSVLSGPVGNPYRPSRWDIGSRKLVTRFQDSGTGIGGSMLYLRPGIDISPDGKRVVTGGMFGHVVIFDASTGEQVKLVQFAHKGNIWTVDFSPDGRRFVTAGSERTARIWDAATGEPVRTLGEAVQPSTTWMMGGDRARYSSDGTRILTQSLELVRVWDAETGRMVVKLGDHPMYIDAEFSPDGRYVRTSNNGNMGSPGTWIWDAKIGELVSKADSGGLVSKRGFSPDSRHVLAASDNVGVEIRETETGTLVRTLALPGTAPMYAEFSSDGRYVLAMTNSQAVMVWEAATGNAVLQIEGGVRGMGETCARFTPDSKALIFVRMKDRMLLMPLDVLAFAESEKPRDFLPAERTRYDLDR